MKLQNARHFFWTEVIFSYIFIKKKKNIEYELRNCVTSNYKKMYKIFLSSTVVS